MRIPVRMSLDSSRQYIVRSKAMEKPDVHGESEVHVAWGCQVGATLACFNSNACEHLAVTSHLNYTEMFAPREQQLRRLHSPHAS